MDGGARTKTRSVGSGSGVDGSERHLETKRVSRRVDGETSEIEKFIIRQQPIGEKDEYDSENSWISDGLPSSSRRRRRGGGRWEVGEWREK